MLALAAAALPTIALAQAANAASTTVEPVVVVGNAPLNSGGIEADKVAGEVQTLSVPELTDDRPTSGGIANLIGSQLAAVSLNDEQGSPFQPDFTFRGFEASPISGVAAGLAVYQDGVRLNEAFGDNVNWDLVPEFAIRDFTVQSNNPAFGLNALGGAVTLRMKDGLSDRGGGAELTGGSFGDVAGHGEFGARFGDLGLYLGVGAVRDDGFRYHSPSEIKQGFGDLAYQHGPLTVHLTASGALNAIDAVGPTPVEMLAADRRSVFTYPQAMKNTMAMVQLRGTYAVDSSLSISASLYYRRFEQRLVDGNTTDVRACANDGAQFCLQGAGQFPGDALYDSHGNTAPTSVLPAGATPGETDFTHTLTDSLGAAAQVSLTAPVAGHGNNFLFGASVDHGSTRYTAFGELGTLAPDLRVVGSGLIIDQGLSPTASPPIEAPVSVVGANTYVGVYVIDAFDLTPRLSLTASGRFNSAQVGLSDQIGTALNGQHAFTRFNPGVGATYRFSGWLNAYAGYSESNRAPTAGELSCADPTSPCLLDAFLVSDPPLKQVVSRNVEVGVRGHGPLGGGVLNWSVSAYRNDAADDILLVATEINGFGFFRNAGGTRRQGVDADIRWDGGRWRLAASYAHLDATFRNAEVLASNSPAADADGLIYVKPGDRIPMSPTDRLTLSADIDILPAWTVGADLRLQSGQYLVGDASNQTPELPGFATVSLRTDYRAGPRLVLFAEVQNLMDRRYDTYGAFTGLDGLPPNLNLTNPRTYSPAQGRAFTAGARVRFD